MCHLPDLRAVGGLVARLVVETTDAHHLNPRVVGQPPLGEAHRKRRVWLEAAGGEEISHDEEARERVRQRRVATRDAHVKPPARAAVDETNACHIWDAPR